MKSVALWATLCRIVSYGETRCGFLEYWWCFNAFHYLLKSDTAVETVSVTTTDCLLTRTTGLVALKAHVAQGRELHSFACNDGYRGFRIIHHHEKIIPRVFLFLCQFLILQRSSFCVLPMRLDTSRDSSPMYE